MFFRIRSDHNTDNSIELLKIWIDSVRDNYHLIDYELNENEENFEDEQGPAHWPISRFTHVISLREKALNFARNLWADYVLVSTF